MDAGGGRLGAVPSWEVRSQAAAFLGELQNVASGV